MEAMPETRGNVAIHGFWHCGATVIFNIRVTDTNAPSHQGQDPKKVLAKQEKEKKDKYVKHYLTRCRHFTPLIFLVDGLQGAKAEAAMKLAAQSRWSIAP